MIVSTLFDVLHTGSLLYRLRHLHELVTQLLYFFVFNCISLNLNLVNHFVPIIYQHFCLFVSELHGPCQSFLDIHHRFVELHDLEFQVH